MRSRSPRRHRFGPAQPPRRRMTPGAGKAVASTLMTVALLLGPGLPAAAQETRTLRLRSGEGSTVALAVAAERGFDAVPLSTLEGLGWSVASDGGTLALRGPEDSEVLLQVGSPFFRWNGEVLQAADAPYEGAGSAMIPVQLLSDFLPRRLPDYYSFDGPTRTLEVRGPGLAEPPRAATSTPIASADPVPAAPTRATPEPPPVRVVVIDPGHGGEDPGTLGPGGLAEKNIALGISRRLAEILRREPDLEVHETREDDTLVPLWDRGPWANEMKGDRPGVFISIHANSAPVRNRASGFETYFLSEARTEHERRVEAVENAPYRVEGVSPEDEPDLGFILRELRMLNDQHWSALLAELVQSELESFHPGPNRGVKQALLAVLTNALMPSILIEIGYLSNAEEARVLGRSSFQEDAAEAIARAVLRFFERYPPGSGTGG